MKQSILTLTNPRSLKENFRVYEGLEEVNFYRFVVTDQRGRISLATGLYPDEESDSIGKIFEKLLREFIKVVRISRTTHTSYMENWHFNLK